MRQPRIGIIGAGIAGLNAALTLHDAGFSCDIYEASHRIGGRMHSDTTPWDDGMVAEYCGEFIDGDHTAIRKLAARFGLKMVDLGLVGDNAGRVMYFRNRYYSAVNLAKDFQAIAPTLQQQFYEAGFPTTYNHYTEMGYRLDHMSVYEWVEQYVKGGHDSPLGLMLNGACRGVYGMEPQEQSALNLVYMFASRSYADDDESSAAPTQGTSKIAGGNQRLPEAIAAQLPDGSIHLNHQLAALRQTEDDAIALTLFTSEGVKEVTYDHVILTLPFSTLRRVDYQQANFDTLKQIAIEQLGYGTISKLMLQFDTPYWYRQGVWPSPNNGFIVTDLAIQTLWDTSIGQHSTKGLLVNYTSGNRGAAYMPTTPYSTTSDADSARVQYYARECVRQLEQVFPGISAHYSGIASLGYSTGDPYLLGSYSCWRVGQYTQFGGYERVRQGPIHFAGEHCSIEFQGYMEGGAREGVRAAQEIVQDMRDEAKV